MMRAVPAMVLLAAVALMSGAVAAPASQTPSMPPSAQSATPSTPPSAQSVTPEAPPAAQPVEAEKSDRPDRAGGSDKDAPEAGTVKAFHDIEFVWVPAGSFVPGLEAGGKSVVTALGGREEWFSDEGARPAERFSKGFWMSKTEITRRQWSRVMGSQPWADHEADNQLDVPAAWVTWKDAAEFAKTLAEEGEPACRLPSENEWEYACRAGEATLFPFGDDPAGLDECAWYRGTAPDGKPRPVAGKKPNAWGLCDMLGNAWEWCADPYGGESAVEGVDLRVIRGGAANQPATFTRPTVRMGRLVTEPGARVGFRIVREP
jgi:formylglycine-generating enzyme required for sulfatase activity